jgi:predicted RNA methylase
MEISNVIYSIHNSVTLDFLRKTIRDSGWALDFERDYKFEIRHTFDFHRKEKALFDVTLLRMVRP